MSIRKKKYIYGNRLQETGNPSLCIPEQKIVKTREGKGGTGVKKTCTGQTVCGLNSVINISTHQM